MNQLITNKTKSKTIMRQNLRKRKSRLVMRATFLALCALIFVVPTMAQQTNIYMKDGNRTIQRGDGVINFYDSHGPSQQVNYWETWYAHNENFTYVFKPAVQGDKIKVTFKGFNAYAEPADPNSSTGAPIGMWVLRLNDDVLKIYDGNGAVEANLIASLTGNSGTEFSVMSTGAITFKFVSNGQYREEGWFAEVELVQGQGQNPAPMAAQTPIIQRSTCSDAAVIIPTTLGAKLYYTISTTGEPNDPDPNDPLSEDVIEYTYDPENPELIPFPETMNPFFHVKAVSTLADGTGLSGVAYTVFSDNDRVPVPDADDELAHTTITRVEGTNTIVMTPAGRPTGLNDTYQVRYTMTTNGTEPAEPTYNNSTVYTGPITATVNGTIFKAKTFAVSCTNQFSEQTYRLVVDGIYAPAPVIDFNEMTITATEGTATFDILYTLDGSMPSVDPETGAVTGTYSANTVSLSGLTPGQTVRAIAYRANNDSGHTANLAYTASQVVTAIYVPSGGSGTYGGTTILLDDREDHSWSYYSDKDQPIHSLNPADVKIAYFGNGTGTVTTSTDATPGTGTWTQNATGVQVGVSNTETENQFIYLKTLERVDGTTSENPTGRCEYTTIPNPFSKRPTYGSGDTRWRGFYGWRIKTLRGGKIYSAATGGTEYTAYTPGSNLATTNYLNAETTYYFAPDGETGMEVELEALWARAYVVTTGNQNSNTAITNTSVGYERNFVVLAQNQTYRWGGTTNPRISSTGYASTVSRYYPDGTVGNANANLRGSNNITLGADTKFENLAFSNMTNDGNSRNISAEGFNLVIGRGVTGTVSRIQGLSANATSNFKMRIESGTYNYIYFMGSYGLTTDGKLTAVLGTDYDRAKKSNTTPKVNNDILGSNAGNYGSSGTSGTERFHCTVKSGNYDLGSYGSNRQFYLSSPNSSNVYASRTLIVEGGIFSDISGGWDSQVSSTNHDRVTIRIKGGTIKGAVYGAAQQSNAYGNRRIIITGGEFAGWIAGGANGITEADGTMNGISYVYVGGKANVTGTNTVMNRAIGGNVFGAGCGYNASSTSGQVTGGTNVVIADEAVIQRGVYGGGSYGYTTATANIYILGGTVNGVAGGVNGTSYLASIKGGVFGGACQNRGGITNVTMTNGTVSAGIYGGSNYSGTVSGLATVNVSGGTAENVFGGGCGSSTIMSDNTRVTVTGGTINTNMYGGGEEGDVNGNAVVIFEGGSVTDIYGAGKGTASNVAQGTTVNVKGGLVNGSVYGGGENGTVAYNGTSYGSIVSVSGGEVKKDVFGGGKLGTTNGTTTVNISGTWDGTVIRGDVFAGAYGQHGSIYVAGLKTLNISGGRIYGSVYGGSRNANDANTLSATFEGSNETATTSVVNISGGRIDQHVYAAGYYGNTVGSVYAFIGLSAINDAPHHSKTTGFSYDKGSILIGGSVWAGGDWGVFTGSFGAPTISGNSNIYINGEGYSTDGNDQSAANYMNIQSSILGCGTSCDAGKGERVLILSHYGADIANSGADSDQNPFAYASRDVNSIQRFHNVIFDDAHLGFLGLGKINSLDNTAKFALYEIDQNVYLANGSTMVMNVPSTQIYSLHSVTCPDTYAATPTFTPVAYNGLGTIGGETDNKIRVNGGSYIEIRYEPENGGSGSGGGSGEGETLTYDFDDGSLQGWTTIQVNTSGGNWLHSNNNPGGYDYTSDTHSGTGFAMSYSFIDNVGAYNTNAYLVSPSQYMVRDGASLNFWYNYANDTYPDYFEVCIATASTPNANSFTSIWSNGSSNKSRLSNNELLRHRDNRYGGTWREVTLDLSSYDGQSIWIAFHHQANDMYEVWIDDITITLPAEEPENPEQPTVTYDYEYGELSGYAHMMAGNPDEDATCAYARPKQSQETGNILPASASAYFNNDNGNWTSLQADGGFVSYKASENDYSIAGALVSSGNSDQMRYENHYPDMRDNSEYYRIWRKGGDHYTVEAVANVHASGSNSYKTVEVEVELPSWGLAGSYYRFDRTNNPGANNTLIDYGSDVMCFNGANYSNPLGDQTWMYWQDDETTPQVTGATATDPTVAAAIGQNGILSNPNLNFGLVIEPGKTMKTTDVNYIINSEADTYLASVEKPFNCDDNTHKPTVKLVLTYSDKLSANATLDPVLIKLVQCNAQGQITGYVTIKLIINTSMNLTSGFTTQIYARMDGSSNIRETSMVPVVLPTFNVAESGENAQFYLKKVDFIQNDGVVIESAHGSSVVCAETRESASSSGTALNIDRFAMTIGALSNPDNTDDWRNVTGPQDAVQRPNTGYGTLVWGGSNDRGVHLGDGKGRNPLSFAITMFFNANELAPGKSKMGDMVFTIEVLNFEGGAGANSSITFTITVEVYRLGPGENFYVDGINGQDLSDTDRAKFPDKPAKTVNFIFNRLGYMPGDNIFVVNELPISKTITWDGSKFQNNVKIYRYPGGHMMTTGTTSTESNPNGPYLGPLVDVTKTLNMKGVIMDGMYAESTAPLNGIHNPKLYPTGDAGNCTYDGIANAPLITISNGGRANLTNTTLQNNYNNKAEIVNAGGAIHVTYEGILAMNDANRITANYNANGGGVYVDGSMIVSDYAYVFDNYKQAVSGSKADPEQNNVMLAPVTEGSFRVVQLGTSNSNDAYDELLPTSDEGETKIGVTKDDWDHAYDGYMPVTYAETGSLTYLNDPYNTQSMVVHDGNIFKLERYVSSEYSDSPNYLYWLGTWVTAVTWNPYFDSRDDEGYTDYFTEAQLKDIHTSEQLAWAISIVNGENYCTPQPNTNFTLTADIDMAANIWVPIGNETALYNGTFEGNGHVVTGLRGSITRTDMGMFGRTDANANIQNMVVSTKFNTNSDNLGTVVGNMTGGTLSNVEGAGENTSRNSAGNNGGLVGINSGTIHSCFSVATISGGQNMGGLVAVNHGDLFNSYSASAISEGNAMAGIVATNNGRVENCYDATDADVAFASKNNGTIRYCYTAEVGEDEEITYVSLSGDESTLEKYGTYGAVKGIKEIGYMYGDNKVTAEDNETIGYVKTTHEYLNGHTVVWDGLLSVLNQWVADGSIQGKPSGLSTWNRPLTQALNSDLPVLAFPKDNCLGNLAAEDGKMLYYSAYNLNPNTQAGETFNNGLDHLLGDIYDGKAANIFLYNNTKDVENGTVSNKLFINEDAALIQKATNGNMPEITATVGVTFDNSSKNAHDYWGNLLEYDWHLLSTPLADAQLGITYGNYTNDYNYWEHPDTDKGQAVSVENSYMPNMSRESMTSDWALGWDFYTYYEPKYHWINFKRNINSHHHFDEPHENIPYVGMEQTTSAEVKGYLIPGRGYMMAIDQDSYLSNKGTLNSGDVKIKLTISGNQQNDPAPTKDWGSNLVGNPYQAYLNLDIVTENTGLSNFYVYDAENGTYGPYMTGASINPAIPSKYIHPHQGFFVVIEGNPGTEQELKFTNGMATATPNETSYFRGEEQPAYPVVNLFAENEAGNRDMAIIELNRTDLGGVRKLNNLRNANFKISAHLGGQNYGLMFTPEGTEKVPVHFDVSEDGVYTLTWSMYNGDFTSLRLVDNKTGVNYDMLANDHYTFEASADDYASRFYITYNVIGVDENVNEVSNSFAFFNGSEWVINGKGHLDVIDVTGRVLYAAQLNSDQNRVNLDGIAKGVYLLRVIDNKVVRTQKIIVR